MMSTAVLFLALLGGAAATSCASYPGLIFVQGYDAHGDGSNVGTTVSNGVYLQDANDASCSSGSPPTAASLTGSQMGFDLFASGGSTPNQPINSCNIKSLYATVWGPASVSNFVKGLVVDVNSNAGQPWPTGPGTPCYGIYLKTANLIGTSPDASVAAALATCVAGANGGNQVWQCVQCTQAGSTSLALGCLNCLNFIDTKYNPSCVNSALCAGVTDKADCYQCVNNLRGKYSMPFCTSQPTASQAYYQCVNNYADNAVVAAQCQKCVTTYSTANQAQCFKCVQNTKVATLGCP